mmetsp:Transcript_3500/g.9786  ORF Transcript_3500/g.9786 Transcript_3500/m.9786 type:complete len:80 (+) Transcript_3500:527-766(+)
MQCRLNARLHFVKQVKATGSVPCEALIAVAQWRSVCDEDVSIFWDDGPLFPTWFSALEIKCPIAEPRLQQGRKEATSTG